MEKKVCVVFLCNKAYFDKFIYTCNQLLSNGNYQGDICLVIGNDLNNDELLENEIITRNNIIIKYFPNIQVTYEFMEMQYNLSRPSYWVDRIFQYHKLHLFNTFFKRWDYIFYLDCGITIFNDISSMLNEVTENRLLAHSDAYPGYEMRLRNQFDSNKTELYTKLTNTYNLNIDYFQTTIMLYDTKIIEEDTFDNLYRLMLEYPISTTNDQGIVALYFTNIKPVFKQINIRNNDIWFYDYYSRNAKCKYIMLKSLEVFY